MIAAVMILDLHLPACQSLKQKRQILHGIRDRVRNRFGAAYGELDSQEKWQKSKIAFALIGTEQQKLFEVFEEIKRMIESNFYAVILEQEREII